MTIYRKLSASDLLAYAIREVTADQALILTKCLDMGWKINKVEGFETKNKLVVIQMADRVAVILPDGKLQRPEVGKTSVKVALPISRTL